MTNRIGTTRLHRNVLSTSVGQSKIIMALHARRAHGPATTVVGAANAEPGEEHRCTSYSGRWEELEARERLVAAAAMSPHVGT